MINNPVGFVICRIGAVLVAISAFNSLGFVMEPLLIGSVELSSFLMIALITLAPLVAAFFLWVYADRISYIPFAAPRPAKMSDFNLEELVGVGMHLIGIYILAFGIISMFGSEALTLAQSLWFADRIEITERMAAHAISRRVSYVVQIVVGLVLVIRGKRRLVL